MGIAIFPKKWTQAPQGSVAVHWGHPLAQYLRAVIIAGPSGFGRELVSGRTLQPILATFVVGSTQPVGAAAGIAGMRASAAANTVQHNVDSSAFQQHADGLTVFARMVHQATPDANATLFGMGYSAGLASPYLCCAIEIASSVIAGSVNNGTIQRYSSSAAAIVGVPQTYSHHGSPLGNTLMRNGVRLVENATASGPITFGAVPPIFFGDPFNLSRPANSVMDVGYLWAGRQMKGIDLSWVHAEPYLLLRSNPQRQYFTLTSAPAASTMPPHLVAM